MARHTFHFRTFASDETENWNLPEALTGATPFGLYYFLEGEATHICSFTASSRVEFLENVFIEPDDDDAMQAYLDGPGDDLRLENDGKWSDYFGYIDVKAERQAPYIGPRQSFTLDTADYDLDRTLYADTLAKSLRFNVSHQQAHADAQRECLREFTYEAAREEFSANSPAEPPILGGGAVLAAHKAKLAMRDAERAGPPPLFAASGIDAPLALDPRH